MTIEGISGAGMTYQGSRSVAAVNTRSEDSAKETTIPTNAFEEDFSPEAEALMAHAASEQKKEEGEAAKQNEQIRKAVENINKNNKNTEAVFGIHDGTNRVTIKIVDKNSREVIKEFPPEKTLDMIEKVWEMAGLMVDEKR